METNALRMIRDISISTRKIFRSSKNAAKHSAPEVESESEQHVYLELPLEVWYLIATYIRPEDIGRFAGTCRAAYSVTKSLQFWRHLYKKYVNIYDEKLPKELGEHVVQCEWGLRRQVVRALYYVHEPFRKTTGSNEQLVGQKCIEVWQTYIKHHNGLGSTNFIFLDKRCKPKKLVESTMDSVDAVYNMEANPDTDKTLLCIISPTLVPVGHLHGTTLITMLRTVSRDMLSEKMVLQFGSSAHAKMNPHLTMTFDNVRAIHTWKWWHPKFPTSPLRRINDGEDDDMS